MTSSGPTTKIGQKAKGVVKIEKLTQTEKTIKIELLQRIAQSAVKGLFTKQAKDKAIELINQF